MKQNKDKQNNNKTEQKRLIGTISINSKGIGFVAIEGFKEDILIEEKHLNTALHGDSVEIVVQPEIHNKRRSGEVIRIEKRIKEKFVGVLEKAGQNFFLLPDDKRMYKDIFVSEKKSMGANVDQKVQVKITRWEKDQKNPEGEVINILGAKGDNEVELHSIVLERGFEIDFPKEVTAEAEKIKNTEKPIRQEEISRRKDFRNTTTFTIDPADAKDFDDAISYKDIDEEFAEIGVHIADVSHYVTAGTALDTEALKRACSIYLVDRTIPMLPEVLSNDLCSLNPNEDKLTFSAVFVINKKNANIKERWFGKTIINSNKRFTYENAQETLDKKSPRLPSPDGEASGGQGEFISELENLNRIAKIMQKEKFASGAIDFEQSEVKFRLDEKGKPIEVYKKERLDTHKLVEEYMLLANREVAEFIFKAAKLKKGMVGIYRIHDVPQPEKIADLAIFLKALGHELPVTNGKVSSKDINMLLKKIEGSAEESLIKTATIRSMAKAIYSPSNIGHFGLAFSYYTHFTSPIRRYPDLLVQRIVQDHITGAKISQNEYARLKKMAEQSSEREIKAAEAERASIKMKQVEYMSERLGQTFEGSISGVTEWGVYVEELNTKCEGMIRLKDLTDDFYTLDQKNYRIVGQKSKKTLSLGDKVKFKVKGADVERKTLDYELVTNDSSK